MRCGAPLGMLRGVGLTCLIVDDNPRFHEVASHLLRRDGIAIVGSAATIAEALRMGRELNPDVWLVDIDLGDESGFDLARRIDAAAGSQPACVVLTSSYAESDYAELIASCPVAGFLDKSRLSGSALQEIVARNGNGSS